MPQRRGLRGYLPLHEGCKGHCQERRNQDRVDYKRMNSVMCVGNGATEHGTFSWKFPRSISLQENTE